MIERHAAFLLDTGPLSTLCGFPIADHPYLYTVLQHAEIMLAEGVITEAGRGRIWRIVAPLINSGDIKKASTSNITTALDTAYSKDLGLGERATIKAALEMELTPVIDDKDAFIVGCRFGLRPIGFQDWIVRLVREHDLPRETGIEIVQVTSSQYPRMFLAHTLEMLAE